MAMSAHDILAVFEQMGLRTTQPRRLIAEAMVRRDALRAAALMAEHIAQGRDAVLDAMAVAEETEQTVI